MCGAAHPKNHLKKGAAWRAAVLCGAFAAILLGPPVAHADPVQLSCQAGADGFVTVFPDEFGYLQGCSNRAPALFDPLGPNPTPRRGTVCGSRTFVYDEARTLRQHFSATSNGAYTAFNAQLIPGSDHVVGTTARESAFTLDGFPGVTVHLRQTVSSNVLTQTYTFTNGSAQTYRMRVARIMDADFDPETWSFHANYADLPAAEEPRVLDTTKTISVSLKQSGDILSEGYRIYSVYDFGAQIFNQAEQYFGFPAANLNGFFRAVHPSSYLELGVNENNLPTGFGTVAGDSSMAVQALMELPPGESRRYVVHHTWAPGAEDDCDGVPASQDSCPDTEAGEEVGPDGCSCRELALTLLGAREMTLECGVDTWVDPGAVATEWCGMVQVHKYNSGDDDGDGVPGSQDPDDYGPGPDTSAEGTYSVQYIAWNTAGTTVSAIRTVHVNDSTPPTLALKGPAHQTHTCGSPWVDPGVEATDACYGNVSPTVVSSGHVNGWVEGTYTVVYSLKDSGGNSAPPVTRTVEVVDCPW